MRRLGSHRFPFLLLLAAALFVRAFVPAGMMPERSDGGSLVVRLCASGGLMAIPLGREAPAEDDRRAEPPCAFAGLAAPAAPPPMLAELPLPDRVDRQPFALAVADERPASLRLLPPARAPPLSV